MRRWWTLGVVVPVLLGVAACNDAIDEPGGGRDSRPGQEADEPSNDAGHDRPGSFAFVVHADPATGDDLREAWSRLVDLTEEIDRRNAELVEPHRITIMFTGNWGDLMARSPESAEMLVAWVEDGHEFAFHSHTHNHAFPDGYTNAAAHFGPDQWDRCSARDEVGCTLDEAYRKIVEALEQALGAPYDIRFAGIGPQGNGGPGDPWGRNDNRCSPSQVDGVNQADMYGCIQEEMTGSVATGVEYLTAAYHVGNVDPDDPDSVLGRSRCSEFAEPAIYTIPHAAFETETSSAKVSLTAVAGALDLAEEGDIVGVVIHPASYVPGSTPGYDGDARARIDAIFEAAEAAGYSSSTLTEVRAGDENGGGADCW